MQKERNTHGKTPQGVKSLLIRVRDNWKIDTKYKIALCNKGRIVRFHKLWVHQFHIPQKVFLKDALLQFLNNVQLVLNCQHHTLSFPQHCI